jgi:hypothetical protein
MTAVAAPLRQACQAPHRNPLFVPAETWSWVFGMWLCHTCLTQRTVRESLQTPGAALDGWKKPSDS